MHLLAYYYKSLKMCYLSKGNHLGKYEPVFDPLDVRGLSQPSDHADEQSGGRQHHRQVDRDSSVEEVGQAEEGSGVADGDQQHRGKEGHHGFVCQPSLKNQLQTDFILGRVHKSWRLWIVGDEIFCQLFFCRHPRASRFQSDTFFFSFWYN